MKKMRLTIEKIKAQLESLYLLLNIAPDKEQILSLIKEKEKILNRRLKNKKISINYIENKQEVKSNERRNIKRIKTRRSNKSNCRS